MDDWPKHGGRKSKLGCSGIDRTGGSWKIRCQLCGCNVSSILFIFSPFGNLIKSIFLLTKLSCYRPNNLAVGAEGAKAGDRVYAEIIDVLKGVDPSIIPFVDQKKI